MVGGKILNRDNCEIPDQSLDFSLDPDVLLALEQVVQECGQHLIGLAQSPELEQPLHQGEQGTHADVLHQRGTPAELEADRKHAREHATAEER